MIDPSDSIDRTMDPKTSPLFTFSAYPLCFSNHYDGSSVQQNINNFTMDHLEGWICADFVATGYDPALTHKNPVLIFSIAGIDLSDVRLDSQGNVSISQVMHDVSISADVVNNKENSAFNSNDAGYSNYRDHDAALTDLKKAKNPTWVSDVVSLGAAVVGFPELVPLTSSIAGVVTSYIGGGKEQSTPLNFIGKLKFNTIGTFNTIKPITSKAFYLNQGEKNPGTLRPNNAIPWGIFNLDKQPNVVDHILPSGTSGYIHQVAITNAPRILVNPAIGFTSVQKGIAFTFDEAPPGMMINPNAANPGGIYFEYSQDPRTTYTFTTKTNRLPTGMALQLICDLPGNPVLMPRRNEILKVYPITVKGRITADIFISGPYSNERHPNRYRLDALATDGDPNASLTYTWNFNPVFGPVPGGDGRSYQDGGILAGPSVEMDFQLADCGHDGALTVTDSNGFSVVTPFSISPPSHLDGR